MSLKSKRLLELEIRGHLRFLKEHILFFCSLEARSQGLDENKQKLRFFKTVTFRILPSTGQEKVTPRR